MQAKTDFLSDDNVTNKLYPLVRDLFMEDAYPSAQLIIGAVLQFLNAQSLTELAINIDGRSGDKADKAALALIEKVLTKVRFSGPSGLNIICKMQL